MWRRAALGVGVLLAGLVAWAWKAGWFETPPLQAVYPLGDDAALMLRRTSSTDLLEVVDVPDGRVRWRAHVPRGYSTGFWWPSTRVIRVGERVVVRAGAVEGRAETHAFALDDGEALWNVDRMGKSDPDSGFTDPFLTFAADGTHLVELLKEHPEWTAVGVDPATGAERWRRSLGDPTLLRAEIRSSRLVLVGIQWVRVVDLDSGETLLERELYSCFTDETLLLQERAALIAVDLATMQERPIDVGEEPRLLGDCATRGDSWLAIVAHGYGDEQAFAPAELLLVDRAQATVSHRIPLGHRELAYGPRPQGAGSGAFAHLPLLLHDRSLQFELVVVDLENRRLGQPTVDPTLMHGALALQGRRPFLWNRSQDTLTSFDPQTGASQTLSLGAYQQVVVQGERAWVYTHEGATLLP